MEIARRGAPATWKFKSLRLKTVRGE